MEKLDLNYFIEKYDCQDLVNDFPFLRNATLYKNDKLTRTLGRVFLDTGRIELSSRILMDSYKNIRETLIHEMIHLVADKKYNESGHGRYFKLLMNKYADLVQKNRFIQGDLNTYIQVDPNTGKTLIKKREIVNPFKNGSATITSAPKFAIANMVTTQ